ncbi:MAG: D-hexose-6-phosphate mutarotase [Variovorax sp.]|nr:D-hexose-6-phosphate mutarotase [Variovorax sp.]
MRLTLPEGDSCTVALYGAQVLSWITGDGVERLYTSPRAVFDGHAAIRGGTPICWPQFNQRGALAKHGFARNLPWAVESAEAAAATLVLRDSEATRRVWPHVFRLRLRVALRPRQLRIALEVHNSDAAPWTFAAALHTYLRVDDIAQARLEGLRGANRWDAVRDDRHVEAAEALRFDGGEFDSVYAAPAQPLRLVQPATTLQIAQSASCTETVVWNPGASLAGRLADLPGDGWRHMLCVEAARIDENVLLQPGADWQGWQHLTVL